MTCNTLSPVPIQIFLAWYSKGEIAYNTYLTWEQALSEGEEPAGRLIPTSFPDRLLQTLTGSVHNIDIQHCLWQLCLHVHILVVSKVPSICFSSSNKMTLHDCRLTAD